jgi:hypothetical protein
MYRHAPRCVNTVWNGIIQHRPHPQKSKMLLSAHTTIGTDWGCGVMHIGQISAASVKHQCCSLPSDAPKASSCTACQTSREENSILQHDNARSSPARLCGDRIQKLGSCLLPHPAHSPDLAHRTTICSGSYRTRCEASTMRPMTQTRKPSVVVYKLLKLTYAAIGYSHF